MPDKRFRRNWARLIQKIVDESDFRGLGLPAAGDVLQKGLDEVNREFLQLPIASSKIT